MIAYLCRRLVWLVIILWVIFTISFFLMRLVPGSPFIGERNLPPEIERNFARQHNLDKPLWQQYLIDLQAAARGDLKRSIRMGDFSVNQVIAEGFPISASLGMLAMCFALTLGLFAGVISSLFRGTPLDLTVMSIATLGIALPNFVIAGICIILFVFLIPLFPAAGWGSPRQMILPAFCLGAPYAAYVARIVRTSMLDVLSQDHIRTARAKGLGEATVAFRHALRNALMPVVSFLGPATAGILTGSLVVEKIFALPGLGSHFVQAALLRDYTLAMGMVLLYTALLYTMNLLVDLSYAFLDPRVELE